MESVSDMLRPLHFVFLFAAFAFLAFATAVENEKASVQNELQEPTAAGSDLEAEASYGGYGRPWRYGGWGGYGGGYGRGYGGYGGYGYPWGGYYGGGWGRGWGGWGGRGWGGYWG